MAELYAFLVAGALIALLLLLAFILRFSRADADLALLAKGAPPRGAFHGNVVWITGASQGIGEMLAEEFSILGALLILSARNEEKLEKVKQKIQARHPSAAVEVLPLDLAGGPLALRAAVAAAEGLHGGCGVHLLLHNAGHPRPKMTCLESSDEFLRAMFEVNVFAPIELTRAILPSMIQRGAGSVVVVSSAAGVVPSPTQGVYAASKHALNGYFHTLRYELMKTGVKVCVVCPGPIATATPRKLPRGNFSAQDVYSAVPDDEEETKNRMTAERCAELIVRAAAHGIEEGWISQHPVLLFMYVMQYFPWLGHRLLRKIGPKRVRALKDGEKDLYSTNLLFGISKKPK